MKHIEDELSFDYVRSSGPGGQNINKVATAVKLRFDITHSPSLQEQVKSKLIALAGWRVSKEGILLIEARRFRTQEQNRTDALERFRALVKQAHKKPTARKKTTPSRSSKEEWLKMKKKRGEIKQLRSRNLKLD